MSAISISDARATLPTIIERVLAGEEITLTRHGKDVAVVVRPDRLRSRRAEPVLADAARLRSRLDEARARPLHTATTLTAERADELADDVVAERSRP